MSLPSAPGSPAWAAQARAGSPGKPVHPSRSPATARPGDARVHEIRTNVPRRWDLRPCDGPGAAAILKVPARRQRELDRADRDRERIPATNLTEKLRGRKASGWTATPEPDPGNAGGGKSSRRSYAQSAAALPGPSMAWWTW
jgi:hypothetical protein